MSIATTPGLKPRTMIVRLVKAEIDELPLDSVSGNLQSFVFAFRRLDEVSEAHVYDPAPNKAVVGELMPDGADAYRIEVKWAIESNFDEVQHAVLKAYNLLSKVDKPKFRDNSQMAVYTDNGDFDYYIGAGG